MSEYGDFSESPSLQRILDNDFSDEEPDFENPEDDDQENYIQNSNPADIQAPTTRVSDILAIREMEEERHRKLMRQNRNLQLKRQQRALSEKQEARYQERYLLNERKRILRQLHAKHLRRDSSLLDDEPVKLPQFYGARSYVNQKDNSRSPPNTSKKSIKNPALHSSFEIGINIRPHINKFEQNPQFNSKQIGKSFDGFPEDHMNVSFSKPFQDKATQHRPYPQYVQNIPGYQVRTERKDSRNNRGLRNSSYDPWRKQTPDNFNMQLRNPSPVSFPESLNRGMGNHADQASSFRMANTPRRPNIEDKNHQILSDNQRDNKQQRMPSLRYSHQEADLGMVNRFNQQKPVVEPQNYLPIEQIGYRYPPPVMIQPTPFTNMMGLNYPYVHGNFAYPYHPPPGYPLMLAPIIGSPHYPTPMPMPQINNSPIPTNQGYGPSLSTNQGDQTPENSSPNRNPNSRWQTQDPPLPQVKQFASFQSPKKPQHFTPVQKKRPPNTEEDNRFLDKKINYSFEITNSTNQDHEKLSELSERTPKNVGESELSGLHRLPEKQPYSGFSPNVRGSPQKATENSRQLFREYGNNFSSKHDQLHLLRDPKNNIAIQRNIKGWKKQFDYEKKAKEFPEKQVNKPQVVEPQNTELEAVDRKVKLPQMLDPELNEPHFKKRNFRAEPPKRSGEEDSRNQKSIEPIKEEEEEDRLQMRGSNIYFIKDEKPIGEVGLIRFLPPNLKFDE